MGSTSSSGRQPLNQSSGVQRPPQQVVSIDPAEHFSMRFPSSSQYEFRRYGSQQPPNPPRLDIQQTCVVKNPVNLRKKSLSIERDENEANVYYLEFDFDASTEADIVVYYVCKEVVDATTGLPTFESSRGCATATRRISAGMGQHFRTTKPEALNLLDCQLQQLQYKEGDDTYPVIIHLRGLGAEKLVQSQYTFGTLVQKSNSAGDMVWGIQTIKQKIQYGERSFEVQEIYGIDRGGTEEDLASGEDELMSGRECVICLAEERNTAVLPCRHMCLCRGCANIMRMQSNKCPICRQTVVSLLQISVSNGSAPVDAGTS